MAGTFNEADHPRAENGQFGEGSGSGKSGSSKSGSKAAPKAKKLSPQQRERVKARAGVLKEKIGAAREKVAIAKQKVKEAATPKQRERAKAQLAKHKEKLAAAKTKLKTLREKVKPPKQATAKETVAKSTADLDKKLGVTPEDHAKADAAWQKIKNTPLPPKGQFEPAGLPDQDPVVLGVENHMRDKGFEVLHGDQVNGWKGSSTSDHAMQLHGALTALGVEGSSGLDALLKQGPDNDPAEHARLTKLVKKGSKDPKLRKYVKEQYLLSQAALRDAGVKEVTLYRGVAGQLGEAKPGDSVTVKTRPVSSWTDRKEVAEKFGGTNKGDGVLSVKVPAKAIYMSHHLMGNNGENEFAVLGSHVAKVE